MTKTEPEARFSPWQPASGVGAAPEGPGVVQIKVAEGILPYPTGRSAMVWYGAGADMRAVATAGLEIASGLEGAPEVLWRWRATAAPERLCGDLLGAFERRFGSPPFAC